RSVDFLSPRQTPKGDVPNDKDMAPIQQGSIMTTANSLVAFARAFTETGDIRYKQAADRAVSWISSAPPETTQDKVFKILALSRFGGPESKSIVQDLVEVLQVEQEADGGWRERRVEWLKGPNAFATGQVLYAFKQAGVSITSSSFNKGVRYLLATQRVDGSWPRVNSDGLGSTFAPTMWAVIGLAGSF